MIRSASSQDDESVFLDEGKCTDWIPRRDSTLCCSQMKIQRRSLLIVPMERRIRSSWRTTITRISPKMKHPHVKSNDARASHLDFDRCRKRSRTSLSLSTEQQEWIFRCRMTDTLSTSTQDDLSASIRSNKTSKAQTVVKAPTMRKLRGRWKTWREWGNRVDLFRKSCSIGRSITCVDIVVG